VVGRELSMGWLSNLYSIVCACASVRAVVRAITYRWTARGRKRVAYGVASLLVEYYLRVHQC